ncbi:hypothetical protein WSM22_41640 [Cytophagales bacterium WSM2-2]|nr:hypothetical protein WSM22_41640 [Cytophagales bacterium WSM2-2]
MTKIITPDDSDHLRLAVSTVIFERNYKSNMGRLATLIALIITGLAPVVHFAIRGWVKLKEWFKRDTHIL